MAGGHTGPKTRGDEAEGVAVGEDGMWRDAWGSVMECTTITIS